MVSSDIRTSFLDFFKNKGHRVCASSSLVPHNDPSLLFTTAGMVQFKDIFTGAQAREYPSAVTVQKCVRAGGKHNDLDQVGHTARHHTFFEMLGNFSFGDYFKEKAILYAWEFLTRVVDIPKEKLWITVYHTDEEACLLWKKIAGLSDDRIIKISTLDNFWSAGDTGPCGPCSEIFYDHGAHIPGGLPGTPDQDGDRFVELWNLVFMEFDQKEPGHRITLPAPSIDTGMGLERLAAVLQGVTDNFDTDILRAIIEHSGELSSTSIKGEHKVSHRVIADHLRSSSFLIADGVLPSNEGRGYVLRRIIRRALRHVHYLKAPSSHLSRLVSPFVSLMGDFYPEISQAKCLISSVLVQEGEKFADLLTKGLDLLEGWIDAHQGTIVFPGANAFQLYDTFGFPLDLTQDILKDRGLSVDETEFYTQMDRQKEKSRQSWVGSGAVVKDALWGQLSQSFPPTEFVGYEKTQAQGTLKGLVHKNEQIETLYRGQEGYVISDVTPFYGESGGQVGDRGKIEGPSGVMEVSTTYKHGNLIVHKGVVKEGTLTQNDPLCLTIDGDFRKKVRRHHSATHLLQAALRKVLGTHVMQKGSLVTQEKLRFDFSHHHPLTTQELEEVEDLVNEFICQNFSTTSKIMDQKQALQEGAMAFFGEKYESSVRVITMGKASKELCGGTHVQATGEIGFFKITHESGIASGIRRIEAVVGEAACNYVHQLTNKIKRISTQLRVPPAQIEEKICQLLQKKNTPSPSQPTVSLIKEEAGSIPLWHGHSDVVSPKELKSMIDRFKQEIGSGIIVLCAQNDDKTTVLVGVTQDLTAHFQAPDLVAAALGKDGAGGGRPDLAQGGGTKEKYPIVIERIKSNLEKRGARG